MLELGRQLVVALQHGQKLLVACQGLQFQQMFRLGHSPAAAHRRPRSAPTSCNVAKQFGGGGTLFVGLAGDAGGLEELAQPQTLPGVHQWRSPRGNPRWPLCL